MKNFGNNFRTFVLSFFALALCYAAHAQKPIKDLEPTIILVAIDGFRSDYFEKHQPETINSLAANGVRAQWMKPSFPTKTFPNFYTVATGLYPANHGIVENNIWDFDTIFSMSKREEVENPRWWGGEPIWVTAEKNNIRSAAMFYPGTEAEIGGKRPTFWHKYDHEKPREERVAQVLKWLDLPRYERPRFITLYFHDVDSAGHSFGPDAAETRDAVQKIDAAIERLVDGLKVRKIFGKVNLILVSDHGMAELDLRKVTLIDDHIDLDDTDRVFWGEQIVQIFPRPGKEDLIAEQLSKITYAKCWKKADIPARFNYGHGKRVAPIVCFGDEGRFLTSRSRYNDQLKKGGIDLPHGGHGYDNDLVSMQAMFVGHGGAFKRFYVADPFPNVDVYELMCRILKIVPTKNDGNFEHVKKMLK